MVGEGKRTIVSLDGDLYDHAVKLKDHKKIWCIKLGGGGGGACMLRYQLYNA